MCFLPFKALLDLFIHETFLFLGGFGLVTNTNPRRRSSRQVLLFFLCRFGCSHVVPVRLFF